MDQANKLLIEEGMKVEKKRSAQINWKGNILECHVINNR
jgi:hypothetical protein